LGLPPVPKTSEWSVERSDEDWERALGEPEPSGGLTSLFDRLVDDSELYEPLRDDEEFAFGRPAAEPSPEPQFGLEVPDLVAGPEPHPEAPAPEPPQLESEPEIATPPPQPPTVAELAPLPPAPDMQDREAIAALMAEPQPEVAMQAEPAKAVLFKVVGRGFAAIAPVAEATEPIAPTRPARRGNFGQRNGNGDRAGCRIG